MRFSTRAIHVGQDPDSSTGATIPPISLSTTFTHQSLGQHRGYEYSRSQNPTRKSFEECLASLEEGEECAAFASGLAATTAVLQSLRPGDGVVAGHDLYGGTVRLLEKSFIPWGLKVVYPAGPGMADYRDAMERLENPRLLWLETPSNPLLDIVDIAALVDEARQRGIEVAVDNTFASPFLQKPLLLGADLVIHSTTKYLGGHSDVVGGAVIARKREALAPIRFLQNAAGAVPGPLDCYLVLRGMKTLSLRMERHCSNARRIAQFASGVSSVRKVCYPGLSDHPGHAVASRQMSDFGGMVTLELDGGLERTRDFFSRLKIFSLAESLGGVESLCSHPATMTHASVPVEVRESRGITDSLVRLSVGIEDIDDLLEDLSNALWQTP
jgi:cystathionine gamma-lyase